MIGGRREETPWQLALSPRRPDPPGGPPTPFPDSGWDSEVRVQLVLLGVGVLARYRSQASPSPSPAGGPQRGREDAQRQGDKHGAQTEEDVLEGKTGLLSRAGCAGRVHTRSDKLVGR